MFSSERSQSGEQGPSNIWLKANATGTVRVIVDLNTPTKPEPKLSPEAVQAQRQAIAAAEDKLLRELARTSREITARLITIAALHLKLDPNGLAILERSDIVQKVREDQVHTSPLELKEPF